MPGKITAARINEIFLDEFIKAGSKCFYSCVFDGCVIENNEANSGMFNGCHFTHCRFIGDGWPPDVLNKSEPKIKKEDLKHRL